MIKLICYTYIIVLLILTLVEIILKRNIKLKIGISFFLVLGIIMGANIKNPDTFIYEKYIYYNNEFFAKDFGFGILVQLFKNFNLTYYHLKMFVTIVGFILINHTLKRYIKDYKFLLFLYIIYPFFYDVVQVRNFLAMSIFIFALPYLLEKSKSGNIKYIISILIAATMQKTALVYLPIIFINKLEKKKFIKAILIIVIFISILISIVKPIFNVFVNILINNISMYLDGISSKLVISTNYGWIIQWIIQFMNYYFVTTSFKYIKEEYETENMSVSASKNIKFTQLIININLYMFIFLPLYILTPTFNRIPRNIYLLNFIVYSFVYNIRNKKNKYNRLVYCIILSHIVFYILQYVILNQTYFTEMVQPILNENWIFFL